MYHQNSECKNNERYSRLREEFTFDECSWRLKLVQAPSKSRSLHCFSILEKQRQRDSFGILNNSETFLPQTDINREAARSKAPSVCRLHVQYDAPLDRA